MRPLILICILGLVSPPGTHAQRPSHLCDAHGTAAGTRAGMRPFNNEAAFAGKPAAVRGQVVDLDGKELRATITLHRLIGDTTPVARIVTASGEFFLDNIPTARTYILMVKGGPYYQTQWQEVRLISGITDSLCVRLRLLPIDILEPLTTGDPPRQPTSSYAVLPNDALHLSKELW